MAGTWLLLLSLTLGADGSHEPSTESAQTDKDGFKTIFNGKDLTGWNGDPTLWSIKDGVIHGETTVAKPAKGNTFLIWQDGQPADFELKLLFRCNATNNSGIQYRSKHITEGNVRNKWVVRGYQHELRNELKFPNVSGFIYDEGGKRARVCLVGEKATWQDGKKVVAETFLDEAKFATVFKLNDWNEVTIKCHDNHIEHSMNGTKILDFIDDPKLALRNGVIALQLHAGKPMWAEFKSIRIRELSK